MRLLHVIVNLNPDGGGPQTVALNLSAAHAGLGHDVTLAALSHPKAQAWLDQQRLTIPDANKVRTEPITVSGSAAAILFGFARSPELERLIPAHDFVYLHGVWDAPIKISGDIARRQKIPYAIVPHGMLDPWSLSQRPLKKKAALALGYRSFFNHAALLHVLTEDEKSFLAPLNLTAPAEVIPNGIWPSEVQNTPPRGAFRQEYPQLGNHPYVLFLSRIHYKKGLDYLADAFAEIAKAAPETRLVVAGPDGGALADFQSRIAAAHLTDRVLVTGPLYGRAKTQAVTDASVFCLPSRQEGFSMAILEALACHTPVVISENCHFPEIVAADAGAVVPLTAHDVANAVMALLRDPQRAAQQGANGARLVLERYTWPVIAQLSMAAIHRAVTKARFGP